MLTQNAQSGNRDAMDQLIAKHDEQIVNIARRIRHRRRDVDGDDLAQVGRLAFVKCVYRYRASRGTLWAFASVAVLNAMIDLIRGDEPCELLGDYQPPAKPITPRIEQREEAAKTLLRMNKRARRVCWQLANGSTTEEVGKRFGVSPNAVAAIVHRARKQVIENIGVVPMPRAAGLYS